MSLSPPPPLVPTALDGVRVLDLTDATCAYATKMLRDLGADVVRIEPPGGHAMRRHPPLDPATGESMFDAFMNAGKRSVTLDLASAAGQATFARLVATADIVVESHPAGSLDELGIGPRRFTESHPALVWTSVTPFGASGPRAHWRGDDLVMQAMGGLMFLSGRPGREPLRLFGDQSCYIAGLHAASGTLIAWLHASAAGEGQVVDVSIQECIAHTLENAVQYWTAQGEVRQRPPAMNVSGCGMFPCTDGEIYVHANVGMIASSWHNLVKWLREEGIPGAEELAEPRWSDPAWTRTEDARRIAAEAITQLTRTRSKNLVYDQLQQRRILSAPMSQVGDLFNNAQLKFLDWFCEQQHGSRRATWPGPAFRMSETPRLAPGAVPRAGEHTGEVAASLAPAQQDAAAAATGALA